MTEPRAQMGRSSS